MGSLRPGLESGPAFHPAPVSGGFPPTQYPPTRSDPLEYPRGHEPIYPLAPKLPDSLSTFAGWAVADPRAPPLYPVHG
jgi:hypothetical protein